MDKIQLYNGDCLKTMNEITDNSVDMILCDLPYQETGHSWDKCIDLQELFKHYRRIIKDDGCIALTGSFKFGMQLYNAAPDLYKYEWVWEKDNSTNIFNANHQPLRIHEYIYIFGKGRVSNGKITPMKYNPQKTPGQPYKCISKGSDMKGHLNSVLTDNTDGSRYPTTIQKFIRDKSKLHPTQKPIALCEYLIKTYTNENDMVLDNCMGSGTTGVACKNLNRNFIGIELDENYYKMAVDRILYGIENKIIKDNPNDDIKADTSNLHKLRKLF